MPKPSSPTISNKPSDPVAAQDQQETSSQETWWEAVEILDQKGDRYLISWAGVDKNGNPYEPTWERKRNCSPALLRDWKKKQLELKKAKSVPKSAPAPKLRSSPVSIPSSPAGSRPATPQFGTRQKAPSRRSTDSPPVVEHSETQTSEYIPSQVLPISKDATSPTTRKQSSLKRKSSFHGVVIPSKSASPSAASVVEEPKEEVKKATPPVSKAQSSREETPEGRTAVKKRRLIRGVIEDSQPEVPANPVILDTVDISSAKSPVPVTEAHINSKTEEVALPPSRASPRKTSSQRPSRSKQSTPSRGTPARHRSLSPVTKVDTWLSLAPDSIYDNKSEVNTTQPPATQNLESGTFSQANDAQVITSSPESGMDQSNTPPVNTTTPILHLPRQIPPAQVVQRAQGSRSPSIPGHPSPHIRPSPAPSRLSASGSGISPQPLSSALRLRERLQSTHNSLVFEQIRAQASYAKKSPSLTSSATNNSILSAGTTASSMSTDAPANFKPVKLGEREVILAVGGSDLQARMTRGALINKQTQIQEFCLNPNEASGETVETMKELMRTCSHIATHPYLIIVPPLANADLPESREAEYLTASSGKFVALGKILDALKGGKEVKIGIVVQNAKGMDLVEGFLRGRKIRVTRTDGQGMREQQVTELRGGPNIILVLGGRVGSRAIVNRVDVVIAIDLSCDPEDDQVLRLRQHPMNLDELSPLIRLVTVNSAEHVRLCLPSPYEIPSDRAVLQGLVTATTILRNFNGMDVPKDDERYKQVAEYIRSGCQTETDVFKLRDIESYMAGHRGLAGLALKRARSPTDEYGGDRKRLKMLKATWQQPSLATIQRENDELHETLGRKQNQNESLRSELEAIQSRFDSLNITKENLEKRLEESMQDNMNLRNQMTSAPETDPLFMQSEINRLTKALESKSKDFEYVTSRYQEASAAASEASVEVIQLKAEVEKLKRQVESDIKLVTWKSERKTLTDRVKELEDRCKLLEHLLEEKEKRKENQQSTST